MVYIGDCDEMGTDWFHSSHQQGWGENDRGVSFTFGADVVGKFLEGKWPKSGCMGFLYETLPSILTAQTHAEQNTIWI